MNHVIWVGVLTGKNMVWDTTKNRPILVKAHENLTKSTCLVHRAEYKVVATKMNRSVNQQLFNDFGSMEIRVFLAELP